MPCVGCIHYTVPMFVWPIFCCVCISVLLLVGMQYCLVWFWLFFWGVGGLGVSSAPCFRRLIQRLGTTTIRKCVFNDLLLSRLFIRCVYFHSIFLSWLRFLIICILTNMENATAMFVFSNRSLLLLPLSSSLLLRSRSGVCVFFICAG